MFDGYFPIFKFCFLRLLVGEGLVSFSRTCLSFYDLIFSKLISMSGNLGNMDKVYHSKFSLSGATFCHVDNHVRETYDKII